MSYTSSQTETFFCFAQNFSFIYVHLRVHSNQTAATDV